MVKSEPGSVVDSVVDPTEVEDSSVVVASSVVEDPSVVELSSEEETLVSEVDSSELELSPLSVPGIVVT